MQRVWTLCAQRLFFCTRSGWRRGFRSKGYLRTDVHEVLPSPLDAGLSLTGTLESAHRAHVGGNHHMSTSQKPMALEHVGPECGPPFGADKDPLASLNRAASDVALLDAFRNLKQRNCGLHVTKLEGFVNFYTLGPALFVIHHLYPRLRAVERMRKVFIGLRLLRGIPQDH